MKQALALLGLLLQDPAEETFRKIQEKPGEPAAQGLPYDVGSCGADGKEGGEGAAADLWNRAPSKRE